MKVVVVKVDSNAVPQWDKISIHVDSGKWQSWRGPLANRLFGTGNGSGTWDCEGWVWKETQLRGAGIRHFVLFADLDPMSQAVGAHGTGKRTVDAAAFNERVDFTFNWRIVSVTNT